MVHNNTKLIVSKAMKGTLRGNITSGPIRRGTKITLMTKGICRKAIMKSKP